jgi:hypothetical protein
MGAERARLIAALQAALLRAAGEFSDNEAIDAQRSRLLATAAALDYVLMLATGTAGVRIPVRDAERAMHEGIARGVDDLIVAAAAIVDIGTPAATSFARDVAKSLREILREEDLSSDERSFAVIALANA